MKSEEVQLGMCEALHGDIPHIHITEGLNPCVNWIAVGETAMTAEQDIQQVLDFYNNWHDHSDDFTPDRDTVGLVLAYAAHVREAAQGEIAGLQRGFVNIYHFVTDKDCDPKIGIGMSTSAVCQLKEKLEAAERKLAELEKEYEHALSCMDRSCKRCGAALASLRAESKEPVD